MFTLKEFELPHNHFRPGSVAGMVYVECRNRLLVLSAPHPAPIILGLPWAIQDSKPWEIFHWKPEETALNVIYRSPMCSPKSTSYPDIRFHGLVIESITNKYIRLLTVRSKLVVKKYRYESAIWRIVIKNDDELKVKRVQSVFKFGELQVGIYDKCDLWKVNDVTIHMILGQSRYLVDFDSKALRQIPQEQNVIVRQYNTVMDQVGGGVRQDTALIQKLPDHRFFRPHRPRLATDSSGTWIYLLVVDNPADWENRGDFERMATLRDTPRSQLHRVIRALDRDEEKSMKRRPLRHLFIMREQFPITYIKYSSWLARADYHQDAIAFLITEYLCGPVNVEFSSTEQLDREKQLQQRIEDMTRQVPPEVVFTLRESIRLQIEELDRQEILEARAARKRKVESGEASDPKRLHL